MRCLEGCLASPEEPLPDRAANFESASVLDAVRLRAAYTNNSVGRMVAGARLLCPALTNDQAVILDLGEL